MSSLLTLNLIQVSCSKSTVNYQLKTLEIVKFVTFLSQNDNMLVHMCSLRRLLLTTTRRVPPPRNCVLSVRNNENVGAIHSAKFRPVRLGKVVYFKRWTGFFRNFSGWTEPIHWVLDRNFRKFWLNGLRPWLSSTWSRLYV